MFITADTLRSTYAILEIDPHFTKDSAIVVMHDNTLDRTSNGKGKIADYTGTKKNWKVLQ